ncbi:hypothetical protein JKG68_28240 [Microvirga aerilata]|uniref:Helix-turn-helix domain-containing protein n=1 Tax=Microvirga aerilata TaxID=670292 RepID=A0A936ZDF4_9HYPH|nr:hypothetical protein [Microvirga aerilata]MBL0407801.1 hypothetical protein [Microvirga aerilata]
MVMDTVMDHDDSDEWCSINEAARRLGVTPTAIRNRIKRGTLKTKPNGNHGRLVHVPRPLPAPVTLPVTDTVPETMMDTIPLTVIEPYQARIADLEARADELRADVERERGERFQERERADQERARADRLTDEVASLARELASTINQAKEEAVVSTARMEAMKAELEAIRSRSWWKRLVG